MEGISNGNTTPADQLVKQILDSKALRSGIEEELPAFLHNIEQACGLLHYKQENDRSEVWLNYYLTC